MSVSKNKIFTSKLLALLNFLSLPVVCYMHQFFYAILFQELFDFELILFEKASNFLLLIMTLESSQRFFVSFFVVFVQMWNQNKILKFLKKCFKVAQMFHISIDSKDWKVFEKKCSRILMISTFLGLFYKTFYFFSSMKVKWQSFLVITGLNWNELSILFFMIFVSFILNFVEFLIKKVNDDLEKCEIQFIDVNIEEVSLKIQAIQNVVKDFRETFGTLLSFVVFFSVTFMTMRVRNLCCSTVKF